MKLTSTYDIENLMRASLPASALRFAFEIGLFHTLKERPMSGEEIAEKYLIPTHRAVGWLNLLVSLDLLMVDSKKIYYPTDLTEKAILGPYHKESWAVLAQEAYNFELAANNLKKHITHPISVFDSQQIQIPNWFSLIQIDEVYAKNFTKMLYERHKAFAKRFAQEFKMDNISKILDLGGGSGVIALELLKNNPDLTAVVIDLENVCNAGKEIAAKTEEFKRIQYLVADFWKDSLPKGFDIIIACDSFLPREHDQEFNRKLLGSLKKGGQLVLITNLDESSAWLDHDEARIGIEYANNHFLSTLSSPQASKPRNTIQNITNLLQKFGYDKVQYKILQKGEVIIRAWKL